MDLVKRLQERDAHLAVVGLGYVGLPLAVQFARHYPVIGLDLSEAKLSAYREGHDVTEGVGDEALGRASITYTSDMSQLVQASFIIVAVPTPVHSDKTPDLGPVVSASHSVGRYLQRGSVVVYESTVYPGVTEEICRPILEQESGLICGRDFKIGYSPERINPGDRKHGLEQVTKIVSGCDDEALDIIAKVYGTAIPSIYRAASIKVAEAAKLVENAQRDVNIAFMNELSRAFHHMQIDTAEVIAAMDTKWNALHFRPGLVGGHCIGVDPYYFIYKTENLGGHAPLIRTARQINEGMSAFVTGNLVRELILQQIDVARARIVLFGMTFKEDCPDIRNSRAVDIYHQLASYGLSVTAVDPHADAAAFAREYGIALTPLSEIREADALVFLVAHREFRQLSTESLQDMARFRADGRPVLFDIKHIFQKEEIQKAGFSYWNL